MPVLQMPARRSASSMSWRGAAAPAAAGSGGMGAWRVVVAVVGSSVGRRDGVRQLTVSHGVYGLRLFTPPLHATAS
eukprot:968126-Prymnesium_polylepis.1